MASNLASGADGLAARIPTGREPAAAAIVRAWRRLTGGGAPTVVACSGGADSTALLLALRSATAGLVVGHVVHDMRDRSAALADRDHVRALAGALGLPFEGAHVEVGGGNAEDGARRGRYAALARMAAARGMAFVASAHHAEDQLESVVMAFVRGAGPDGLSGAEPERAIGDPATGARATLVRPMLSVERADAVRLCEACGVGWREDETNADTGRTRAGLRHGALAALLCDRPGGAARAARSAGLVRDAAGLVADRVEAVFGDAFEWERAALRGERAIVVGAGLRRAALRLTGGRGADRLTGRAVDPAVEAVRDGSGETRRFGWALGVEVVVERERVLVRRGG